MWKLSLCLLSLLQNVLQEEYETFLLTLMTYRKKSCCSERQYGRRMLRGRKVMKSVGGDFIG